MGKTFTKQRNNEFDDQPKHVKRSGHKSTKYKNVHEDEDVDLNDLKHSRPSDILYEGYEDEPIE